MRPRILKSESNRPTLVVLGVFVPIALIGIAYWLIYEPLYAVGGYIGLTIATLGAFNLSFVNTRHKRIMYLVFAALGVIAAVLWRFLLTPDILIVEWQSLAVVSLVFVLAWVIAVSVGLRFITRAQFPIILLLLNILMFSFTFGGVPYLLDEPIRSHELARTDIEIAFIDATNESMFLYDFFGSESAIIRQDSLAAEPVPNELTAFVAGTQFHEDTLFIVTKKNISEDEVELGFNQFEIGTAETVSFTSTISRDVSPVGITNCLSPSRRTVALRDGSTLKVLKEGGFATKPNPIEDIEKCLFLHWGSDHENLYVVTRAGTLLEVFSADNDYHELAQLNDVFDHFSVKVHAESQQVAYTSNEGRCVTIHRMSDSTSQSIDLGAHHAYSREDILEEKRMYMQTNARLSWLTKRYICYSARDSGLRSIDIERGTVKRITPIVSKVLSLDWDDDTKTLYWTSLFEDGTVIHRRKFTNL